MHEPHDHPDSRSAPVCADGLRIGLAVSRYHGTVTDRLREGARAAFVEAGGAPEDLVEVDAPGAFELVAIANLLARHPRIDAVVALGCVITGETTHDQFINHAVATQLAAITVATGTPVAFGVLTCQSLDQAAARAGGDKGNKGAEAMAAAIETTRSLAAIRGEGC
jgi:6,7-dimethyl-8-ribityllumazine synthase